MSKGLIALSPLPVFIAVYLITSVSAGDFYAMPITVAFMLSSIYAVIVSGGIPCAGASTYSAVAPDGTT